MRDKPFLGAVADMSQLPISAIHYKHDELQSRLSRMNNLFYLPMNDAGVQHVFSFQTVYSECRYVFPRSSSISEVVSLESLSHLRIKYTYKNQQEN